MATYIEREALIAAYDAAHKGEPGRARKLIVDAPAADVAPVVRCKDCNKGHPELGTGGCVWCVRYGRDVNTDDFCSYGERRGDG